jgi:alpha-L-rhamnosidase
MLASRLPALLVPAITSLVFLAPTGSGQSSGAPDPLAWPAFAKETRPWTRWWWLGSAVDPQGLTRQLALFEHAGIGGVEICPIYGAKGYESRFVDFLSPRWMEMLAHTTTEASRLGLGVDLTTGTGWPFGGPQVSAADASAKVELRRFEIAGGAGLEAPLPEGKLRCLRAISDQGEPIDLTDKVRAARLDWIAPPGRWRLYAVCQISPIQQVKRAAPGGAGNVLDPYSVVAMDNYLAVFDRAFAGYRGAMPRAQFHDSFEYFGATWTSDFFREFAARRGYDLRTQLPAFFGEGSDDTMARVKYDYRQTIGDLHLAYMQRWSAWAHAHGCLSRDQAHGAPVNLVDLYASADIPETEIFGSIAERNLPMNKFSSSAAHLAGRRLASAESFTWLNEPFQARLAEVKQAADYLFLAGVNHIFFHGIPYSPADAPWPGWQFYASVNFGPEGGLWHDLPEFTAYATRCQSVLQSGASANDVLLYFPLHDIWQTPADLVMPFTMHNVGEWLARHPFYAAATLLTDRGYGYDEVSDHFLAATTCEHRSLAVGGNHWRVLVVPDCRLMPEATLRQLVGLARDGATILVLDRLPEDVPGWGDLEKRRAEFRALIGTLHLAQTADPGIRRASLGDGAFLVGTDLEALLRTAGVAREPAVDLGLRFVRRTDGPGYAYFFANRGKNTVDGWVTLGTSAQSGVLLDPRYEHRAGMAALRQNAEGTAQVYLQLQPGESCILRTFPEQLVPGMAWPYVAPAGLAHAVAGRWQVQFVDGGPALPAAYTTTQLASWTTRDDPEARRFSGTARYTIEFERPTGGVDDWLLDLGTVRESARVRLNGHEVGAFWCAPFKAPVGRWLHPGENTLEIEVTNLAANRVRDLDLRKVNWKYFYDANVLSHDYRPLDASTWPLFDSGLLGPVTLTPLRHLAP